MKKPLKLLCWGVLPTLLVTVGIFACQAPPSSQQQYLERFAAFAQLVKTHCGNLQEVDFVSLDQEFHQLSVIEYQQLQAELSVAQEGQLWTYRATYLNCRFPLTGEEPSPGYLYSRPKPNPPKPTFILHPTMGHYLTPSNHAL